jgi:hypothetical protein
MSNEPQKISKEDEDYKAWIRKSDPNVSEATLEYFLAIIRQKESRIQQLEQSNVPRWVKAEEIPIVKEKVMELQGVIIEHRPAPELYGGVGVSTLLGDYAVMKKDQARAAKLIGHKVQVRTVPEYYATVEILWKESKPPLNTEIPNESL